MSKQFIMIEKTDLLNVVTTSHLINPGDLSDFVIWPKDTTVLVKTFDEDPTCNATLGKLKAACNSSQTPYTQYNFNQIETFIAENPDWDTPEINEFVNQGKDNV